MLADEFFRALPYLEGDLLFGHRCERTHIHTVHSATSTYQTTRPRIASLASECPDLVDRTGLTPLRTLFKGDAIDALLGGQGPFLTKNLAVKHLSTKGLELAACFDEDLIASFKPLSPAGIPKVYAVGDIERRFLRIIDSLPRVTAETPDMASLDRLYVLLRIRKATAWKMLEHGIVHGVRVHDQPLDRGLRISTLSAFRALYDVTDPMTGFQAGQRLEMPKHAIMHLVRAGLLVPVAFRRHDVPSAIRWVFEESEVVRFDRENCTVAECCSVLHLDAATSVEEMMAMGLDVSFRYGRHTRFSRLSLNALVGHHSD